MSIREKRKNETREALINAALAQCATGQSFSSLSLRQVTKQAGVVPATFYRHFKDMEDLGKTIVEESLKTILVDLHKHLDLANHQESHKRISGSINLFFNVVDDYPELWQFVVTERWGGSPAVCMALKEHIKVMNFAISRDLKKWSYFSHMSQADIEMMAEIVSNMFYSWVMDWLQLSQENLSRLKVDFKKRCTKQSQLLFFGANNWQSQTAS